MFAPARATGINFLQLTKSDSLAGCFIQQPPGRRVGICLLPPHSGHTTSNSNCLLEDYGGERIGQARELIFTLY